MEKVINFLAKEKTRRSLSGYEDLTFIDVKNQFISCINMIKKQMVDFELIICDDLTSAQIVLNDYLSFDICNDDRVELVKIVENCIRFVCGKYVVLTDSALYYYENLIYESRKK